MIQTTFVMLKPDAIQRGLVGEIISRMEKKGLSIDRMQSIWLTQKVAQAHYAEHIDKPFYPGLIEFITSGPVIKMVISGDNAISLVRKLVGATSPADAAPGTIRGDFCYLSGQNLIHASDSPEAAEREINLHFPSYGQAEIDEFFEKHAGIMQLLGRD